MSKRLVIPVLLIMSTVFALSGWASAPPPKK